MIFVIIFNPLIVKKNLLKSDNQPSYLIGIA